MRYAETTRCRFWQRLSADLPCELIPCHQHPLSQPSPTCSWPERVETACAFSTREDDFCKLPGSCSHFVIRCAISSRSHSFTAPPTAHPKTLVWAYTSTIAANYSLRTPKNLCAQKAGGKHRSCVTLSISSHSSLRQSALSKSRTFNPSYPPYRSPYPTTFHLPSTARIRKSNNKRPHNRISLKSSSEDKTATLARQATTTAETSALRAYAALQARDAALIWRGTSRAVRWERLALAASKELPRPDRQAARAVSRRRRLPVQESRGFWSARVQHKAHPPRVAETTA